MTPHLIDSQDNDRKMIGSMIIYEAETLAEVQKMVESDIYYTSGVVSGLVISQLLFAMNFG